MIHDSQIITSPDPASPEPEPEPETEREDEEKIIPGSASSSCEVTTVEDVSMGKSSDAAEAGDERLMDRIELASEIVRSSQAAVAFQRAFYLEILTFDRVHREITDFTEKVKKLESKLTVLLGDLNQAENASGASRATVLLEKLETLNNSCTEFHHKAAETKRIREPIYNELNGMILRELNGATVKAVSSCNFRDVRAPNLAIFVNDSEFHLIECISVEWGKLRRKLESYLQKYVEDTVSLRVEVFGATYTTTADPSSPNSSTNGDDKDKGLMQKLSGLILHKKTGSYGGGSHLSLLTGGVCGGGGGGGGVGGGSVNNVSSSCRKSKVNPRYNYLSRTTETSFFYDSDSQLHGRNSEDRDTSSTTHPVNNQSNESIQI